MEAYNTNEKLVSRLQSTERNTPEAGAIITELWGQNINLVKKTVKTLTGLSETDPDFDDMLQQAYFGFYSAAYAFDTLKSLKFSTYAVKCIQWELCRYYENNGHTVRIPAYMRKRMKECTKKKQELETSLNRRITYKEALKALNLSPSAVEGTLKAFSKLETVSTDKYIGEDERESVIDFIAADDDVEDVVISQEWHRELHRYLFKALREIDEESRNIILRHYFTGISIARIAKEFDCQPYQLYNRENKAFNAIKTGKYGKILAEFMPNSFKKDRADKIIKREIEKLQLSEDMKGLLAL